MEKSLAIDLSQSAQQTYAEGSLRLHELVVEKNGKLDPEGVKKALKIVEGMTGFDEKEKKSEWDMKRFYRWAQEELGMNREDAVAWVHLHVQLNIDMDEQEEFIIFEGDLDLRNKPNLKTFPPFKMILGNVNLMHSGNHLLPEGLKINGDLNMVGSSIQELPRDLRVRDSFFADRSSLRKIGEDSFFGPTGLKEEDKKYWFSVLWSHLKEIPETTYINVDLIKIDENQFGLKQQLEKLTQSKRVKGRVIVN